MRPSTVLYLPSSLLLLMLACDDKGAAPGEDTDESPIIDTGGPEGEAACLACPEDVRVAAGDCDGDGLQAEGGGETDPDDCDEDVDDDGLTDGEEQTACVEHRGTTEEVATPSDMYSADTDEDGLSDGDEVHTHGSNPCKTDSDDDGLSDVDELALGLNPVEADTDQDSFPDGEELGWDATGGMARDENEPDTTTTVGMPMECPKDEGATPYSYSDTQHFTNSDEYYPKAERDFRDYRECVCTFELSDRRPAEVIGVTISLPFHAHLNSDWDSNPIPEAVAIHTPASIAASLQVADASIENADANWYAFNDKPAEVDEGGEYDLYPGSAVSAQGTYTVYVTRTNVDGQSIGECGRIGPYINDNGDESALTLTVDTTTSTAEAPTPPPMCSPGATARSLFSLHDLGQGTHPIQRSGARAAGGARAREINVTDWRGAQSLRLTAGGASYLLTPANPLLALADPGLDLASLSFEVQAEGGRRASPLLSVLHTCPGSPPPLHPPAQSALSWADIESMIARLMPGFSLAAIGAEPADRTTPFVTLNLIQGPDGATLLELDQPGLGRLAAWPATISARGAHRVVAEGPGYRLNLLLFQRPWGLDLRLVDGTVATLAGPLSIGPAQYQLRTPAPTPAAVGGGN